MLRFGEPPLALPVCFTLKNFEFANCIQVYTAFGTDEECINRWNNPFSQ